MRGRSPLPQVLQDDRDKNVVVEPSIGHARLPSEMNGDSAVQDSEKAEASEAVKQASGTKQYDVHDAGDSNVDG